MSGTVRNLTAGFTTEGTFSMPNLFAGEQDVITTSLPLAASTAVEKNMVLARNAAGNLIPLVASPAGGSEVEGVPVAIAVEAAASEGSVRNIPVYIAGFFNHAALVWPSGTALDTFAERRARMQTSTSNLNVGELGAVRAPS